MGADAHEFKPLPEMAVMTGANWKNIGPLDNIPLRGARRLCLKSAGKPVAVFRTGEDEIFALIDECPHKKGPLSEGIVAGKTVTCPLHNWVIGLDGWRSRGAGCRHRPAAVGAHPERRHLYPCPRTGAGVTRTTCPYCGVGCGVAVMDGIPRGDEAHPANFGRLCSKGAALKDTLALPDRLTVPTIARQGSELGCGAGPDRRRILAHPRRATARTRSPSMSPASSSPRTITSPTS